MYTVRALSYMYLVRVLYSKSKVKHDATETYFEELCLELGLGNCFNISRKCDVPFVNVHAYIYFR